MNIQNIKVGMKVKVVGKNGGCGSGDDKQYCKHCRDFKCGLIVTAINDYSSGFGNRKVSGKSLSHDSHCTFDPRDLKPFEILNWKEELQ